MSLGRDPLRQVSLETNVIIVNNGNNKDNNSKILEYSRALAVDQHNIVLDTAKPFPSPLESETNSHKSMGIERENKGLYLSAFYLDLQIHLEKLFRVEFGRVRL